MIKNAINQGFYLFAIDENGNPKTGDAANITATISKNGAAPVATATANPTEIGLGGYWLPAAQAETDYGALMLLPVSATSGVRIDPVIVYLQEAMRGTDSAALAASWTSDRAGKIDDILADTNELQTNQGNWATATGFATPANLTTVYENIQSGESTMLSALQGSLEETIALAFGAVPDATAVQAAATAALLAYDAATNGGLTSFGEALAQALQESLATLPADVKTEIQSAGSYLQQLRSATRNTLTVDGSGVATADDGTTFEEGDNGGRITTELPT